MYINYSVNTRWHLNYPFCSLTSVSCVVAATWRKWFDWLQFSLPCLEATQVPSSTSVMWQAVQLICLLSADQWGSRWSTYRTTRQKGTMRQSALLVVKCQVWNDYTVRDNATQFGYQSIDELELVDHGWPDSFPWSLAVIVEPRLEQLTAPVLAMTLFW